MTRSAATTGNHLSMATGRSLGWLVDKRAQSRGSHPFLIWEPPHRERRVWSYAEFARDVRRVAAGLELRGLKRGDTLLLHLDNCAEFLLTWFACARFGAVPVCTNTRSSVEELRYFGRHADVKAAVTSPTLAPTVGRALPELRWLATTDPDRPAPDGNRPRTDSFLALFAEDPSDAPVDVDETAAAWIQYTSGTTSRPKAVVFSHANGLWGARMSAVNEGLTPGDVHFVHLPLFHINAICYSVLASMWAGGTVVLVPKFSASRFWEVSRRNHCTWAAVIPFCTRALLQVAPPEDHSYRLWGNGVSVPAAAQPYGIRNLGWYGMTETVAHPIIDDVNFAGPRGTMGRPAPGYQISVRRTDGSAGGVEEAGSLFVRGQRGLSLFSGYLHDDLATREAVDRDGWLATGDRVVWNADGSLKFSDRSKDMLKVGGENVAASEVERVILEVAGVSEVAVVGAPDPLYGDVPVAFVIAEMAAPGLEERIVTACQVRLSTFKVPRKVHLVDELPRSALNKVAKAELRAALAGRLSNQEVAQ